jgi:hypothetical protein
VVLVGDTAHGMSPNMAQGGALAFEDALVLAGCLSDAATVTDAVAAFVARRNRRTGWVRAPRPAATAPATPTSPARPHPAGVAANVLCTWSHAGRCPSDAAFAILSGAAPIPASSGQTVRVRLNRSGDRQLNQALHLIVLTRLRYDPATRAYAQRWRAQGKTNREVKRSLVRYVARQPYRLLEHPATSYPCHTGSPFSQSVARTTHAPRIQRWVISSMPHRWRAPSVKPTTIVRRQP